jgi:hypothetical protein
VAFQTDTGPMILFGEVEPGSWAKYGHRVGSRVERGQPIAEIGVNPGGDTMLHFEMYRRGTTKNWRWLASQGPPRQLLDPTAYMRLAEAGTPGDIDPPKTDPVNPPKTGGDFFDSPLILVAMLLIALAMDKGKL